MSKREIIVDDVFNLPKYLYHLVPVNIYNKYTDAANNYDCRNKKDWGHNSDFIHTTTTKKILKEKVFKGKGKELPININFILLIIEPKKIKLKFSYAEYNGIKYYHIWGSIPKSAYRIKKVKRKKSGDFIL